MKHLGSIVIAIAVAVGLAAGTMFAQQSTPPRKLTAPVRGQVPVEITKPDTKVGTNEVVTTILVRNVANGPIAGLRVEENWRNKAGDMLAGDTYRHGRPIQPGETIKVELRTPRKVAVGRSNDYQFRHANGEIKVKVVAKLEAPKTPS